MKTSSALLAALFCWFAVAASHAGNYLGMTTEYWNGVTKMNEGNHAGAIKDFTSAIKKERDPKRRSDAYKQRGLAKSHVKDYAGWLEDDNLALELAPDSPEILVDRGNARSWLGDWEGQRADIQRAYDLVKASHGPEQYRLRFAVNLERVDQAFAENVESRDHPEAYKHYLAGIQKNIAKDYAGSVAELTQAIALSPNFPGHYYERAKSRSWIKEWEGQAADFKRAWELGVQTTNYSTAAYKIEWFEALENLAANVEERDHPDAYKFFDSARKKDKAEDYKGAIADYNEAIARHPACAEYFYERGTSKKMLKDRQGALDDLQQAIVLNPGVAKYFHERGKARSWFDRWEEEVADYAKAVSLSETDSDQYKASSDALREARANLAANVESRDHPEAYACFERGREKQRNKDYAGALAEYEKAIRLNPKYPVYFCRRGVVKGWLDDNQGWADDETIAISLGPNEADYYTSRGSARGYLKDYRGKVADYDKAIALAPEDADSYFERAKAKSWLDDLPGKAADYQLAVSKSKPGTEEWKKYQVAREAAIDQLQKPEVRDLVNQGAQDLGKGQFKTAVTHFSDAIQIAPKYANAYHGRAVAEFYLKRYQEAEGDERTAIGFTPDVAEYHVTLAETLATVYESSSEAHTQFETALMFEPDNKKAKKGCDTIESLWADEHRRSAAADERRKQSESVGARYSRESVPSSVTETTTSRYSSVMPCPTCHGFGKSYSGIVPKDCPTCGGTGKVLVVH